MAETQRVSWTLPADMVERVKAHQERGGFASQSEAAADLFKNTGGSMTGVETPEHQRNLAQQSGITSTGQGTVPGRVDPHESYPTLPMVPPGQTVETISTDGAPIDPDMHGEIGDSEEVDDNAGTGEGTPPDVENQDPGPGTGETDPDDGK